MEHGYNAFFCIRGVKVQTRENVFFRERPNGHVLVLPLAVAGNMPTMAANDGFDSVTGGRLAAASVGIQASHNLLARPGNEAILRTPKRVDGMDVAEVEPRAPLGVMCELCVLEKQMRGPFPTSTSQMTAVMGLLHTAGCGPMRVRSTGGANYAVMPIATMASTSPPTGGPPTPPWRWSGRGGSHCRFSAGAAQQSASVPCSTWDWVGHVGFGPPYSRRSTCAGPRCCTGSGGGPPRASLHLPPPPRRGPLRRGCSRAHIACA